MNSNVLRANGMDTAQRSQENTLPTPRSWKNILALALMTVLSAVSGFAAPSQQVANQGLFRPRGMVRASVPNPVLGGAPIEDYWVADGASGFCRIDQVPDPANPGLTHGVLNLTTCYLPGVFEPADYQVETHGVNGSNGYVFVAGINEVTRLEFTIGPDGRTAINTPTQVSIFTGTASVFAGSNLPVGRNRAVQSAKLGPDGKLYICFQGSGDIWRIRNPLSPTFTPAGNAVERVGTSDNGKVLLSLAWVGHDLWMSQAGFLNRIQNADLCHFNLPKCQAILEFGKLQTQEGLASDQFISSNPNGRWLYWANGNRVVRYDTQSANIMQVWNQSGMVNGSAIPQEYTLIMGLNFIQSATPVALPDGSFIEDMTVTTDPIIEAPLPEAVGNLPRTGRTWVLKASSTLTAESCVSTVQGGVTIPPPCVNSQVGNDNPPNGSRDWTAARRAVLLLSGVTHPRGLIFLGTKWWVSDEDHGFCRIDQNPLTGAASMNACFQPFFGFIPGQPAADKPTATGRMNVYLPDAGGVARGVYRLTFIPDANGGTVSQTGLLNSGPGTVAVAAIPNGPFNDGSVYLGYYDNAKITKIQAPATAPSAPFPVGSTSKGVGVLSMSFMGNDLYMAELGPPANAAGQLVKGGQITVLQAASPSLQRGGAREVTKPISRLQSPTLITTPQLFVNPAAIVVGPTGDRPSCLPPLGVALSPRVPKDPGTAPALYFGSMGINPADASILSQPPEVDQFDSICTTEIPWVMEGSLDALRSLNVPLDAVTALAFTSYSDPSASLAIGDDPSTIPGVQTLQRSQEKAPTTGPLHGQGHVYIVP